MAIAVAFVAVTLVTGVVYADEKNGKPFEAIWEAINELQNTENEDYSATTYVNEASFEIFSSEKTPGMILCDEGDVATGGGGSYDFNFFSKIKDASFPHVVDDIAVGWTYEILDLNSEVDLATVFVVCLDNP